MMKLSTLTFLTLSIHFLVACSDASPEAASTPATVPAEFEGMTNPYGEEAAPAGAEVFKSYCATCHGETGAGDGPAGASLDPAPRNLAELKALVNDDYLFWRVSRGKEGTAMVGWRGILTDEQIWQVISFIQTLE